MKQLAIKGHATRGKEVIELLEMMGGNAINVKGWDETAIYVIPDNGIIDVRFSYEKHIDNYAIFTLEEFLEKYPYKVGDVVVYTKFGDDCNDYPIVIKSMKWTGTTMEYGFDGYFTCLVKDLKMWKSKNNPINVSTMKSVLAELFDHIKTTPKEELEREFEEIKEWSNVGPTVEEFMDFCNKVNKKPKYPKTYEECCLIMGGIASARHLQYDTTPSYKFEEDLRDSLETLRKLFICRNAYWKIAGEEMGLGKPWEPDWNDQNINKYCLATHCNMIVRHTNQVNSRVFSFPTSDMRDTFFENFKDLIESCKELL